MTRVLLLSKYGPLAASTRHRFLQFVPDLRARGIELVMSPLLPDDVTARRLEGKSGGLAAVAHAYFERFRRLPSARGYDLVLLQYEMFPYAPALAERMVSLCDVPFVVDYDDAIFHQYDHHQRPIVRRLLGKKIARVMQAATTVVVGSRYLEEEARRWTARVELVPTVIDTERYVPATKRNERPLTVGWIGSPSNAVHLPMVREALERLSTRQRVRLLSVGGTAPPMQGVEVENRPWSEAREVDDLHEMDIGIMPLGDWHFTRGKCAFKLIQYMACGLPVVCSPVGANRDVVREGIDGLWANSTADWLRAFERLSSDGALAARMGAEGRARAVAHYSRIAIAPKFAEILQRAARR